MRSLRKYLRCVWYLWKHRKDPNNRKKYRRFMRDKRAGGYHAWRLLGELMKKDDDLQGADQKIHNRINAALPVMLTMEKTNNEQR